MEARALSLLASVLLSSPLTVYFYINVEPITHSQGNDG